MRNRAPLPDFYEGAAPPHRGGLRRSKAANGRSGGVASTLLGPAFSSTNVPSRAWKGGPSAKDSKNRRAPAGCVVEARTPRKGGKEAKPVMQIKTSRISFPRFMSHLSSPMLQMKLRSQWGSGWPRSPRAPSTRARGAWILLEGYLLDSKLLNIWAEI